MSNELVYRTDELENAIDYLEKAAEFFENRTDKHRFKWLMITLHGALYSFGICNIQGTNPSERVFKPLKISKGKLEKIRQENSQFILGDQTDDQILSYAKYIQGEVLPIKAVLNRCKSKEYMMQHYERSKVLSLKLHQEIAIEKLIRYRNDFAHFKPSAYGISGSYEKDIVIPVVEVIKFLALESNNVNYFNVGLEENARKALNKFYNMR
ncbi:hypothetical protein [Priestia sp. YIM B13489]|uniref:hypothetical protein n=1 Tax=Priestia TaxID=2800373 RepID=UPI00366EFE82